MSIDAITLSVIEAGLKVLRAAEELLARVDIERPIRLTGVSAQDLTAPDEQLTLFAPAPKRSDKLNSALDRIAEKFGGGAIAPADVLGRADSEPAQD